MIDAIKRPVAGCLACVGALIVLTGFAYEAGPFGRLDARILNRLDSYKETSLGSVADFFVYLADPIPQVVMIFLVCALALCLRRPRQAVGAAVLVGGANLTTQALKQLLAHHRYEPILGWGQIGPTAFPSGHSTAAMAIAIALVLVVPRPYKPAAALIGAGFALAVGFSVIILHHHYPSDVAGGWLVAGGWGFAVVAGLRADELLRAQRGAQLAENQG